MNTITLKDGTEWELDDPCPYGKSGEYRYDNRIYFSFKRVNPISGLQSLLKVGYVVDCSNGLSYLITEVTGDRILASHQGEMVEIEPKGIEVINSPDNGVVWKRRK